MVVWLYVCVCVCACVCACIRVCARASVHGVRATRGTPTHLNLLEVRLARDVLEVVFQVANRAVGRLRFVTPHQVLGKLNINI